MTPARDSPPLLDRLRWMHEGTALFLATLADRGDHDLARPTDLEGWTGRHLVAHVASNADALNNLAHWARTGLETPMYSSPAQREVDIADGARRPPHELRERVEAYASALTASLDRLTDEAWHRHVRTAQGRVVDATEIPWLRAREVMVHAVDLGSSTTFDNLPADFLAALVDDVVGRRATRAGPALEVGTTDGRHAWHLPGSGTPATVSGTLAGVAAYLTGRPAPGLDDGPAAPELPAWL